MKKAKMGLVFCRALATPMGMYFRDPRKQANATHEVTARLMTILKT